MTEELLANAVCRQFGFADVSEASSKQYRDAMSLAKIATSLAALAVDVMVEPAAIPFVLESELTDYDGNLSEYFARVVMTISLRDGVMCSETIIKLAALLAVKNKAYGNSALAPKRVFSEVSSADGICVRIDDKISRIVNLGFAASEAEDTLMDLAGYLVLLMAAES